MCQCSVWICSIWVCSPTLGHDTRLPPQTPALLSKDHRQISNVPPRPPEGADSVDQRLSYSKKGREWLPVSDARGGEVSNIPDAPDRWASVSTVIDPVTVKRRKASGREKRRNEKRQPVWWDWSLTFLLSFVLLGFFLLLGYRLRHFPVAWKKAKRWDEVRAKKQKANVGWVSYRLRNIGGVKNKLSI